MLKEGISVIIPYYNGINLLKKNLPSIFQALINTGLEYEVIVSDDASQDSPNQLLEKLFPSVILLTNKENLGFGKNVNIAIEKAKFSLVLILNSDIKIDEHYFNDQIPLFKKSDTFSVGGKIIDQSTQNIEAGWKPYIRHGKIRWSAITSKNNQLIETFYVCGGNALVSKDIFMKLGGFLEIYKPFYLEDVDLSIRAWRSGYKCYYSPNSICHHEKSSTIESYYTKGEINISYNKNFLVLNYLHSSSVNIILWKIRIALQRLLTLFRLNRKFNRVFFNRFYVEIDAIKKIRKSTHYQYDIDSVIYYFNNLEETNNHSPLKINSDDNKNRSHTN